MEKNLSDTNQQRTSKGFDGFGVPRQNWFKMPDEWTDITAAINSLAELKVVEYVLRHTWGYQEYGIAKKITIDEFMKGRKRRDGSRMDRGTGLSKQSVITGLRKAIKRRLLIEEVDSTDKARIKKHYRLRMKHDDADAEQHQSHNHAEPADVKDLDTGVKNLDIGGQDARQRTERDTSERNSGSRESNAGKASAVEERMLDVGLSAATVRRLRRHYDQPRMQQKLDYLDFLRSHAPKRIGRPSGWLVKAIEDDYEPPAGYVSPQTIRARSERSEKAVRAFERQLKQTETRDNASQRRQREERASLVAEARRARNTSDNEIDEWQALLQRLKKTLTPIKLGLLQRAEVLELKDGALVLAVFSDFERQRLSALFSRTNDIDDIFRRSSVTISDVEIVLLNGKIAAGAQNRGKQDKAGDRGSS